MPNSPATEQRDPTVEPVQQPARSPREAELEDKWKRALADLDNFRKRSVRLVEQRIADAGDRFLLEWLEVADSVERALQASPATASDLRAVLDQIDTLLARHGVRRIDEADERFDPERHEAVGIEETADRPPGSITQVQRSGYATGDRVLRPARVLVSRAPAPTPDDAGRGGD